MQSVASRHVDDLALVACFVSSGAAIHRAKMACAIIPRQLILILAARISDDGTT